MTRYRRSACDPVLILLRVLPFKLECPQCIRHLHFFRQITLCCSRRYLDIVSMGWDKDANRCIFVSGKLLIDRLPLSLVIIPLVVSESTAALSVSPTEIYLLNLKSLLLNADAILRITLIRLLHSQDTLLLSLRLIPSKDLFPSLLLKIVLVWLVFIYFVIPLNLSITVVCRIKSALVLIYSHRFDTFMAWFVISFVFVWFGIFSLLLLTWRDILRSARCHQQRTTSGNWIALYSNSLITFNHLTL